VLQGSSRVLGLLAAALMLTAAPAGAAQDLPFSVVFGIDQPRRPPVVAHGPMARGSARVLTFDPREADAPEPALYTEFKPQQAAGAPHANAHVPGILRPALKLLHLLGAGRL
jgi:hypothetical protein